MFESRYHGEVRDSNTTPGHDLATEFNLHLAGSIGCTPKDAAGGAYFVNGSLACVGEGVLAVPIIHAGGGGKLAGSIGCTPEDAAGGAYFVNGSLACVGEGVLAVPIIHAGGGGKLAIDADSAALSLAGVACFGVVVDGKSGLDSVKGAVLVDGAVVLKQSG